MLDEQTLAVHWPREKFTQATIAFMFHLMESNTAFLVMKFWWLHDDVSKKMRAYLNYKFYYRKQPKQVKFYLFFHSIY